MIEPTHWLHSLAAAEAGAGKRHQVELDTVEPTDPDLLAYVAEHEIAMTVLLEAGPGGGCPLVAYAGTYTALVGLILTHFDDGTGTDNYLLEEITPVA